MSVEHRGVRVLRDFGIKLLGIGSVLACALMVILFGLGFWHIGHTLFEQLSSTYTGPVVAESESPQRLIILGVLHGLEFLFLAPLPALVFFSLARYFRSFHQPGDIASAVARDIASAHQVHRIKALILGLMTASVATDLLGRAFRGIEIQAAIAESLVMSMLGAFWFVLERSCRSHSAASIA